MASQRKSWPRNFLLILAFLIIGVQVVAAANEQKIKFHQERSSVDPQASYLNGKGDYSAEDISYFKEIALKVEYGTQMYRIHKWTEELRLKIIGDPDVQDKHALDTTIQTLNKLSENLKLRYAQDNERANVEVYFIPHAEFLKHTSVEEVVLESNWGLGAVWWNGQGEIYQAEILIAIDRPSVEERAHLIREELTQTLGVLNDSWEKPESIFYQGWGAQDYTELDKKVVQILYDERIRPNMKEEELDRALARLNPSILSFIRISEKG